jgi:hypothetical protein
MPPLYRPIAMKLNTAGVVAVVAMVALAGCAGFAPGGSQEASPTGDSPETTDPAETTSPTETTEDDDGSTADSGVVRFYISDEENAIGDFEHLNVTITEVGFQAAGDTGDSTDDANETETEVPEGNETTTELPEDNETQTPEDNETQTPGDETEVPDDENDPADDEDESGDWVEYDVDDRTFDLTQLQGANASLLEEFDVPEGAYNKVFVHVDEINGTLDNGESVNVKLPSEKLQITQSFTVEGNDSVDFVFDITVHKAGNSGKYILTPVISESGTDVPIEDVDEDREDEREDDSEEETESEEREDDEREEEERDEREVETELNASFVGAVEPGANATIQVSANGSAVANATVLIEGNVIGETNQAGEVTILVPEDAAALEVVIESGDAETELSVELEDAPPA